MINFLSHTQKILKAMSHLYLFDYRKCPKISNTLFYTFFALILLFMHLLLKILSGMTNSVDPDQTAVWSGSALFAYVILSETLVFEILGHLPYSAIPYSAYMYGYKKSGWIHNRKK